LADLPRAIQLIDGATGTELDRRDVDVTLPLWSARALVDAPDIVQAIHEDYLRAGASAVTTNSFRTHERSLAKAGWGDRARELTARAVALARAAVDRARPGALVLGSVAPLEDCYRPALAPDYHTCRREHAQMIRYLLDAGADLLLIETMGTLHEAGAAVQAARRLAPGRFIVSFCTFGRGPAGVALSGQDLRLLLASLHDAQAVGVNCVAASRIEAEVRFLRAELPDTVGIAAYANVGAADEQGNWISTDAVSPMRYAEYARAWVAAGATIIGGCCGTRPETIAAVAEACGRG
jgi:S-methylmethionine-dependent homocysteine/selenocysteine methylase